MNRRIKGYLVGLCAGLLAAGCGCSDRKAEVVETKPAAVPIEFKSLLNPKIQSDEAIAVVNGKSITKADYDCQVAVRDRCFRLQNRLPLEGKSKKCDEYLRLRREDILSELIFRELLRQKADALSIVPSEEQVSTAAVRFMKSINKPKSSFSTFCAGFSPEVGAMLKEQLISDVRNELLLDRLATNDFKTVTAEEVSNRIEVVLRSQEKADRLNAEARQRAAAAKAEILGGRSFYEVTTNRAEIFKDQGKFWDVVDLSEFEPEDDLFKFLTTAKQGDISDPLDFDDGIGIVGVLSKESSPMEQGEGSIDDYTLVRCMFNGYVAIDEPEDFKGMRKLLLERKREEAQEDVMRIVAEGAVIEHPFGKALFSQPKKKTNKGKKRPKPSLAH